MLEEQQRQERLAIAIARKEEEVAGLSLPFLSYSRRSPTTRRSVLRCGRAALQPVRSCCDVLRCCNRSSSIPRQASGCSRRSSTPRRRRPPRMRLWPAASRWRTGCGASSRCSAFGPQHRGGAHPCPHLRRDWALPMRTSALGLSSLQPHLHRTPAHICTGTGPTPAHICTGTGRSPCAVTLRPSPHDLRAPLRSPPRATVLTRPQVVTYDGTPRGTFVLIAHTRPHRGTTRSTLCASPPTASAPRRRSTRSTRRSGSSCSSTPQRSRPPRRASTQSRGRSRSAPSVRPPPTICVWDGAHPCPHLHPGLGPPLPTSAPGPANAQPSARSHAPNQARTSRPALYRSSRIGAVAALCAVSVAAAAVCPRDARQHGGVSGAETSAERLERLSRGATASLEVRLRQLQMQARLRPPRRVRARHGQAALALVRALAVRCGAARVDRPTDVAAPVCARVPSRAGRMPRGSVRLADRMPLHATGSRACHAPPTAHAALHTTPHHSRRPRLSARCAPFRADAN